MKEEVEKLKKSLEALDGSVRALYTARLVNQMEAPHIEAFTKSLSASNEAKDALIAAQTAVNIQFTGTNSGDFKSAYGEWVKNIADLEKYGTELKELDG